MAIDWTDDEHTLRGSILRWIDGRTSNMLEAPRAWGSDEAIEMQILLLLQFRAIVLRPEFGGGDPGSLVDAYMDYLTRTYPALPHAPLHRIIESDPLGFNIAGELRKVIQSFNDGVLADGLSNQHGFPAGAGSSAPSEPFDRTEEIRGIDIDRGLVIVNRRARLPCYLRPELLQEVTEVGVQAHVQGTLYKPLSGRAFVIVSHIAPVGDEPPAA